MQTSLCALGLGQSMRSCMRSSNHVSAKPFVTRRLLVSKPPGSNPLDILRIECAARNLCGEDGRHLPGTHWVAALALANADPAKPPNMRTVGIAQLSHKGLDFVVRRGSVTAERLDAGSPVAVLHQHGRFLPGECAEQWRGEGICHSIRLVEIVDCIPLHTATSMMASSLVAAENDKTTATTTTRTNSSHDSISGEGIGDTRTVSSGRRVMDNKCHLTEVMQTTQNSLSRDTVPVHVLEQYLAAYRFQPYRMECMTGGPDSVMWDRWEWWRQQSHQGDTEPSGEMKVDESMEWNEPQPLIPH